MCFFLIINIFMSVSITFATTNSALYKVVDYFIILEMIYASVIIILALIRKRDYSKPIFFANIILVAGIVHDVLRGSYIIPDYVGEISGYTYLLYMYVASFVLVVKLKHLEKSRIESKINFLHAQIQPHFLYNAINTIVAYCRTDPEESRRLLIELSTYLRGKFKSENDIFTPLRDEIELIKSYLTIEQVRFRERLSVEYDIDEECNILIPCLILQPLVENAVNHGLIPKKEGGCLNISVKHVGNEVIVKIKDNGVGINKKTLSDIIEGKNLGIGLSNTNERLKEHYNTQIEVVSQAGKGTEFTVTIPTGLRKNKK